MASDLMTNDVISCDASEEAKRLEQIMTEHQVLRILTRDVGILRAVVNEIDIVNYRMQFAEKEAVSCGAIFQELRKMPSPH